MADVARFVSVTAKGKKTSWEALALFVNVEVLWNTIYMQAALEQLRDEGFKILDSDVARLSPMEHGLINFLGSGSFALDSDVNNGHLRPLRTREEIEAFAA